MCRNISFCWNINTKSKEDFRRRFKVNFLTLDILLAVLQVFEYISYGDDGLIFIISGCMFSLDAILLIWLLSYKGFESHAPKYVVLINFLSNALTIIVYSVSRVFIVFGLKVGSKSKLYQKIIAGTLYVTFFPMKLIKLYIMYQYKKFCEGGSAAHDLKYHNLLASFDITHPAKVTSLRGDDPQNESLQYVNDKSDNDNDVDQL